MLRDLLRFLWTAFIDHWATWVTGTGVVGFLLWGLNYYERFKGTPMKLRTNALILFCTFWFFATFAAWHDADRNLEAAKKQDVQDAKDLGECKGDLKAESGRAELLDGQLHMAQNSFNTQLRTLSAQQQTMNSQQQTANSQQNAMNSCVVALGKANTQEPQKTTIQLLGADNSIESSKHRMFMMAFTNKAMPSPLSGIAGCEHPLRKIDVWVLGAGTMSGGHNQISPTTIQWSIDHPGWTPTSPLIFTLYFDEDDPGRCGVQIR